MGALRPSAAFYGHVALAAVAIAAVTALAIVKAITGTEALVVIIAAAGISTSGATSVLASLAGQVHIQAPTQGGQVSVTSGQSVTQSNGKTQ